VVAGDWFVVTLVVINVGAAGFYWWNGYNVTAYYWWNVSQINLCLILMRMGLK